MRLRHPESLLNPVDTFFGFNRKRDHDGNKNIEDKKYWRRYRNLSLVFTVRSGFFPYSAALVLSKCMLVVTTDAVIAIATLKVLGCPGLHVLELLVLFNEGLLRIMHFVAHGTFMVRNNFKQSSLVNWYASFVLPEFKYKDNEITYRLCKL